MQLDFNSSHILLSHHKHQMQDCLMEVTINSQGQTVKK